MAADVMAEHSPGHVAIGVAELPRHRFAFSRRSVRTGTGVADVVPDPKSTVWGVLYQVNDLDTLDAKEGAGWAYERCNVTVLVDGEPREAITYRVMHPEPDEVTPSAEYIAGILSAAAERGLPPAYVEQVAGTASSSRPPA
jgi:AIG2-like family